MAIFAISAIVSALSKLASFALPAYFVGTGIKDSSDAKTARGKALVAELDRLTTSFNDLKTEETAIERNLGGQSALAKQGNAKVESHALTSVKKEKENVIDEQERLILESK